MTVDGRTGLIQEAILALRSGGAVAYADAVEELQKEYADYDRLFELQHKRMMEAIQLWRQEAPQERELIQPDLGDLLTWLMERTTKILRDDKVIKRAGRILKMLRLASEPGHDAVSIKLNSGLTYDEEFVAKRWAKAFELAQRATDDTYNNLTNLAVKLHKELGR